MCVLPVCVCVSSQSLCVCEQDEIQHLKTKLEKVEKERNELRLNGDRLDNRVRASPEQSMLGYCCTGVDSSL